MEKNKHRGQGQRQSVHDGVTHIQIGYTHTYFGCTRDHARGRLKRQSLKKNKIRFTMQKNNKQYIIKDDYHDKDFFLYLSDETESVDEIWHSYWIKEKEENDKYHPKVFTDKKEANKYLREIKRSFAEEWNKNSHLHKIYGKQKYRWNLYELPKQ